MNLCKCGCGQECKKGYCRGHNRKGVICTPEHILKNSLAHIGKPSGAKGIKRTPEQIRKNSLAHIGLQVGENNPFYKHHHTDEWKQQERERKLGSKPWNKNIPQSNKAKQKNREKHLGKKAWNENIPQSPEAKEKNRLAHLGKQPWLYKKHEKESIIKMGDSKIGDKNPMWLDGKSFEPYSPEFNERLKERIRDRDNHTCQFCMELETKDISFPVHHIDYNKMNCDQMNLITLCTSCHSKTQKNRKYWEEYFRMMMSFRKLSEISIYENKI